MNGKLKFSYQTSSIGEGVGNQTSQHDRLQKSQNRDLFTCQHDHLRITTHGASSSFFSKGTQNDGELRGRVARQQQREFPRHEKLVCQVSMFLFSLSGELFRAFFFKIFFFFKFQFVLLMFFFVVVFLSLQVGANYLSFRFLLMTSFFFFFFFL